MYVPYKTHMDSNWTHLYFKGETPLTLALAFTVYLSTIFILLTILDNYAVSVCPTTNQVHYTQL